MPHLARAGFDAIAPDLPGHGNSYLPDSPPSIADYAESVVALMDALDIAQADLFGHHTGALVAAQLAAEYAPRARRLVLWALAIYVEALRASREHMLKEPPPQYDDEGNALAAFWKRQRELAGDAYTPELGVRAIIEMLQTGSTRPWGHWAGQRCDRAAIIARVPHPVLVMGGQRDPLWPGIEAAAKLFPNGRFHVIENGGLYVTDEQPAQLAQLATRFFSE